jgi:formamidopyrimidine-DNA glycosylase
MPELPEVETVVRGLKPTMEGETIEAVLLRRPDLRFPFPDNFRQVLMRARIESLSRRAKYALADLSSGWVLVMHLGMSGSFRIEGGDDRAAPGRFHHARCKDGAHDHVVLQLGSGMSVIYNDPRRFGFMTVAERRLLDLHPLFAGIGVEPLGNGLSADYLAARLGGRKTSLKAALLDQRIVAGLGNIYVCEALWRAGLSPRRAAGSLVRKDGRPSARIELLIGCIRAVLEEAIEAGGSSLRDYIRADGSLGYFQHAFAVYDREGEACAKTGCSGVVRRMVQHGRSTFYCAACQR